MAEVELVGTDAVVVAVRELRDIYQRMIEAVPTEQGWEQIFAIHDQFEPETDKAQEVLLDAMRADVSPGALLQRPS